ncbi:MAG: SpoIIE family protein phosphatase [Coriobacteriia bacterium]
MDALDAVARRVDPLTGSTQLLAAGSDRESVMARLSKALVEVLVPGDGVLLLLAGDQDMRVAAAAGVLADRAEGLRLSEAPWLADALAMPGVARVHSAADDPVLCTLGAPESLLLAALLHAGSSVIGAVTIVRPSDRGFSAPEQAALRDFAAQASLVLHNVQLLEQERRSRTEAESLRRIAERAASVGDPLGALDEIARLQAELLAFGRWLVIVHDGARYGLAGRGDPTVDGAWRMAWEALRPADDTGAVYISAETAPSETARLLAELESPGALLTPLHRSGELAGFLVLLSAPGSSPISPSALEPARIVGRQASLVLENAHLYQQAKNRADNLETIFRISNAVGSSLHSGVVLNRVLDVVQKILSADAVLLMRYDPQRRHLYSPMARGMVSTEMLEATFRPGEDVPGRVLETHEPERYDRIADSDTMLLNQAGRQGLESALAVPLLARGRGIGVLTVFSRDAGAFSSDELHLLRTFGTQAALAIDNAEMFSREHETVRVLQESILPTRLADIEGIESGSIYVAGGGEAEIGGDYYDLYPAPDGRVVLAIGDVCGKGVNAATKTSMIRYAIRGMVIAGLAPDRIMGELNTMLLEGEDPSSSIVTLWLGLFDTTTGMLTYADGGHPPALLLRPDRTIDRLGTTGALLGGIAGAEWGERTLEVPRSSLLMLYTDGVTEARRANRLFGEGRVRRALRSGGTASQVAERLLAHVQRHCRGDIRDDAAILAVRYLPRVADDCQDVTRETIRGKSNA